MAPKVVTSSKTFATLTAWSYSTYTQYLKCPLSICFDKVQRIKIVEPMNEHMVKGDRVHKTAEAYLRGTGRAPKVANELKPIEGRLKLLRKARALVEQEWAFTKDYVKTTWFGPDVWVRVKVDVADVQTDNNLVHIIDWKTGKYHDEHKQQRSIYALGGLQLINSGFLTVTDKKTAKVVAEHVYLDTKQEAREEFPMSALKPLKREWNTRVAQMMSDTKFPPRVGFHCRYCRYRKSNGGPCPENQ